MQSIYEQATLQEIINRLDKLTPQTQRQWGTMDVAQMMAHCSNVLEMSLGDVTPKANFLMKLMRPLIKPMIVSEKPFKQNMPTGEGFLVSGAKEFEQEKKRLVALLTRFSAAGETGMHHKAHAYFGKFTAKEWSNSTIKHTDHHLRQFGV